MEEAHRQEQLQKATTTESAASYYDWRKTSGSGNVWQRHIDESERFYTAFCRNPDGDPDAASFPVTCYAELHVSDTDGTESGFENLLRRAWVALRREQPSLGSWVEYDDAAGDWMKKAHVGSFCQDIHRTGFLQEEEEWLARTFRTVEWSLDSEEWFNHEPPVFRLPTLFLLRKPKGDGCDKDEAGGGQKMAMYLRCPHDIVDGIGILQLVGRLLELVREIYHGTDTNAAAADDDKVHHRLAPALRIAVGITAPPTESQRLQFQELLTQHATMQTEKPPLRLPLSAHSDSGSKNVSSSRIQRVSITIPETTTRRIVEKCKAHGVTVTHVISAAVMMAMRNRQPSTAGEAAAVSMRYMKGALVNLRQVCCSQPPDRLVVGNYHMIAPRAMAIDIAAKTTATNSVDELLKLACEFREYYTSVRPNTAIKEHRGNNDDGILALASMTWDLFTPKKTKPNPLHVSPQPLPPSQPQSESAAAVSISSLGNISAHIKAGREASHSPLRVAKAWVAAETLGAHVAVFVQSWTDELGIAAIFNFSSHERSCVEAFLDEVLDCLVKGLGDFQYCLR